MPWEIDGLGEKIIDQLVEGRLVTSYGDLYRLNKDALLTLEGFGNRKAEKTAGRYRAEQIARSGAGVLAGIAIRHVGQRVSGILAKRFGSLPKLAQTTVAELSEIDEIGPTIAQSIYDFFHSEYGQATIDDLAKVGVKLEDDVKVRCRPRLTRHR